MIGWEFVLIVLLGDAQSTLVSWVPYTYSSSSQQFTRQLTSIGQCHFSSMRPYRL